ncbi:hypothetical protein [Corynebacterium tapiri]|uniref:Secreted protein n=1 Tax=Corynebacterium tapiri TaxID=1448266 RepID=A0A5C4U7U1_9CORY|nr:hypothetical protein [Corynebacterium tapiri]TNL99761.1 hypothetical protein FHE74_01600 [Corynebacterium tapiri]
MIGRAVAATLSGSALILASAPVASAAITPEAIGAQAVSNTNAMSSQANLPLLSDVAPVSACDLGTLAEITGEPASNMTMVSCEFPFATAGIANSDVIFGYHFDQGHWRILNFRDEICTKTVNGKPVPESVAQLAWKC